MVIHDILGQTLEPGDQVSVPIGFGLSGVGQIVNVSSGLVNPAAPKQPAVPSVTVVLHITSPAQPNGTVMGIVKIGTAPKGNQE